MKHQPSQQVELVDNESGELLQGTIVGCGRYAVSVRLAYPEHLTGVLVSAATSPIAKNFHGYVVQEPDYSDCDPNSSSVVPTINHNY